MIGRTDISIRRMVLTDIPAVFTIDQASAALYWPQSSYYFEVERNEASRPWVAVDSQQRVCGFLVLWLIMDELHVANFAVHPDYRRRGIGDVLMQNGLYEGWKEGARISYLEVRAGNSAAISLYEKIGYRVVNIRRHYYQDNQEDALMMNLEMQDYQTYILTLEKLWMIPTKK